MTPMAIYSWHDLSWKEQRAVVQLARQGRRHPDRRVATVAEEWAKEKLGRTARGGSIGEIIVGALLGDGASIAEGLRDRRAAKRIMRVAELR